MNVESVVKRFVYRGVDEYKHILLEEYNFTQAYLYDKKLNISGFLKDGDCVDVTFMFKKGYSRSKRKFYEFLTVWSITKVVSSGR